MDEIQEYYEEKRIAQEKVRNQINAEKEKLAKITHGSFEWYLQTKLINKLEDRWLWAGYTGD